MIINVAVIYQTASIRDGLIKYIHYDITTGITAQEARKQARSGIGGSLAELPSSIKGASH